jgi:cytochrome P450
MPSEKGEKIMTVNNYFPVNLFAVASHRDETLLPLAREYFARGEVMPIHTPVPYRIGSWYLILNPDLALAIHTNQDFSVGSLDPRSAHNEQTRKFVQGHPYTSRLFKYNVFILPEGIPHQAARAIFEEAIHPATKKGQAIQSIVDAWAAELSQKQGEFDLVEACVDVASHIMAELIGLPKKPELLQGRDFLFAADVNPTLEQWSKVEDAARLLWEAYEPDIDGEEVKNGILKFCFDRPQQFSREDILNLALFLIFLSLENTAGAMYRLLVRMVQTPKQREAFQKSPEKLAPLAVAAGLWVDAPIWYTLRHIGENGYTLNGYTFEPSSHIILNPHILQHIQEDPVFDIQKYSRKRIFGFGTERSFHHCIGEGLARLVVRNGLIAANNHGLLDRLVLTDQITEFESSFFMTYRKHIVSLKQ